MKTNIEDADWTCPHCGKVHNLMALARTGAGCPCTAERAKNRPTQPLTATERIDLIPRLAYERAKNRHRKNRS